MMRQCFGWRVVLVVATVVTAFVAAPVAGQQQRAKTTGWTGRTADGQPDLQGIWANNVITPLQRPLELNGRALLTDQEVASLKARVTELFSGDGDAAFADGVFLAALRNVKEYKSGDGGTGNYNHFWVAERTFDNRTSLVTDPPDGRIPALTPEAEKRMAESAARRKAHPADGPEDLNMSTRCISFGLPNVLAGYNANVQVLQSHDYVVLYHEMIHDARIIPLDGRPHVGKTIRHRLGDSRGRWEGNTLVIETTNFAENAFQGPGAGRAGEATENMRLVERLTRTDANTLQYEFTLSDPMTWTKPWSAMIPWQKSNDKIYEYACHEGNSGLFGILSGHRAEEKAAEKKAQTK